MAPDPGSKGLPPLQLFPPSRWSRKALPLALLLLVVSAGNALLLHFEIDFVDRVRAAEALAMMGHARKEIVLERAQRPAARSAGPGDPVALSTLGEPAAKHGVVIRYARDGDRVVARFNKASQPDEQGVWVLSPVEAPENSDWVSNWRCTSQSTGAWQRIAQSTCPEDGASR
ncbi:hypothetical protein [Hydrogenophaga flava]|uniref:hypothetical protein n=1 Tax=Hydrogenophaga flava TaxID=65657 RepID=UPI0012FA3FF8|nr:hypothetical protein [Hydrogenophaga flava]